LGLALRAGSVSEGATIPAVLRHMYTEHLSDHDLERYYLGMITEELELAPVEEHILACAWCASRAEEIQDYVDAVRSATLDLGSPLRDATRPGSKGFGASGGILK